MSMGNDSTNLFASKFPGEVRKVHEVSIRITKVKHKNPTSQNANTRHPAILTSETRIFVARLKVG